MERYFGPEGLLAQSVKHFEFRASQLKMADAVLDCFSGDLPLMVEAGTGTGKTWAYLVPAILSGKKVIVSTGTKTLQDQIFDQDIPFLKRLVFPRLQAICIKGRRNYLCRRRFKDFSYQPTLWNREEAKLWRRFQNWAVRTATGDRADVTWLPDQFHTWNEVCSASEHCLGQHCEEYSRCFITRLRFEASRAQLLVVNHHLFFADLALRNRSGAEAIPEHDAVIFDEAHQLEDIIGQYFGVQFGTSGLADLIRDLQRDLRKDAKTPEKFQAARNIAQQLEVLNRTLHQSLAGPRGAPGRFPLDIRKSGNDLVPACRQIIHALEQLAPLVEPAEGRPPSFESLYRRVPELAEAARQILQQDDDSLVYWCEVSQQAASMRGTPIEVASIFRDRVLAAGKPVVLTSATLSVGGTFDFLRQSLGLPAESGKLLLPSPFDFARQAVLYIPARFPAPNDPQFCAEMAAEAFDILKKTQGRALFLFTSYRNMHDVHQRLRDRLPYPLLVQGQKPKRALLAEFREKIDSVLFATNSFWQGIDVPGEALSCLIIDKLPFDVPDDPLTAARMEHLTRRGGNSFFGYQVPRAVIQLKQGVGRLIRSSNDRGIIAIFDVRLLKKNYGQLFIKSLPPCRLVHHPEEIERVSYPAGEPADIPCPA